MDDESAVYDAESGLALGVGRPDESGLAAEDCCGKRIPGKLHILLLKSADSIDLPHDSPLP
jgi:hypothetical protein